MPKSEERKLRRIARQRGYSSERTDRYVYGTISHQKRAKRSKSRR